MKFAHIAPTAYINPLNLKQYPFHLLLAHLVEEDPEYVDLYKKMLYRRDEFTGSHRDKIYLLDNSAYELYRAGLPMFEPSKLVDLGRAISADYIVLPDYPAESSSKTIAAAIEHAPIFKKNRFGTFFVPQSNKGDLEDFIACFAWAASSPLVDYIGMSILGIPNAFDADYNDVQRFTSRFHMFNILEQRGLIRLAKQNEKKIHCLGMMDGPNEIQLMKPWINAGVIDSWDSSSAVWAGIEGISYDQSPTGLINGKVKTHVDFDRTLDETKIPLIKSNMKVIDDLIIEGVR